jgi:uncharacterized protein YjiS (DUF1127 family)
MENAMSKASAGSLRAHKSGFVLTDKVLRAFARRFSRRHGRDLVGLDDYMLRDIGLTRADVLALAYRRIED